MINSNQKDSPSIFPILIDLILLVISFFIVIVVLQQILIRGVERPFKLKTDAYFSSGEYELEEDDRNKIINDLDSLFYEINQLFDHGSLKMVRIEGHTDKQPPPSDQGDRMWSTNRELSFFRANTIAKIIEDIAEDKNINGDSLRIFKSKLLPGGFGEFKPELTINDRKKILNHRKGNNDSLYNAWEERRNQHNLDQKSLWFQKSSDFTEPPPDTSAQTYYYFGNDSLNPKTNQESLDYMNQKNRRIAIYPIRK